MDTQSSGNYIREKRTELGLNQEQLAEKVGVTSKTISNWETGKSEIKHANIEKLAEALKVSPMSIHMGHDTDGMDEESRQVFDQIIKDLYNVEEKALLALDIGGAAFGVAIIATALATGAFRGKTDFVLWLFFFFGVLFIVSWKSVLRRHYRRLKEKREKRSDK